MAKPIKQTYKNKQTFRIFNQYSTRKNKQKHLKVIASAWTTDVNLPIYLTEKTIYYEQS